MIKYELYGILSREIYRVVVITALYLQFHVFAKCLFYEHVRRKENTFMDQYSYKFETRRIDVEHTRDLLSEMPDFCVEFINDKLGTETYTPKTCLEYTRNLKSFLEYIVSPGQIYAGTNSREITLEMMEKLTYRTVSDYMSYLTSYQAESGKRYTNGAAAKARKLAAIRSMYNFYIKRHKISNNPCIAIDTPRADQKDIVYLRENEKKAFYRSVNFGEGLTKKQKEVSEHQKMRDYMIITLFLATGMRVSELVGIDLDDVNSYTGSIMINRKGRKSFQNIYLDNRMMELISDYVKNYRMDFYPVDSERALFLNREGNRISVRSVEKIIKKYANASLGAGNKITPHKLRSTYGTDLYQETGDIYLVADALGHSNVNTTTKHYANMSETQRKKAADYGSKIALQEEDESK